MGAVAGAVLAGAGLELAECLGLLEVLVADGGFVGVPGHHLALVDHVAAVDRVGDDLRDVLGGPGSGGTLARVVLAHRRGHAFAGQALGQALPAVAALEVEGEDPLHRLEGGPGLVGDHQAAVLDHVAEGRAAVDPQALAGLGAHPTLHAAGQLLGVALGQPGEDGSDQLADGAVLAVLLGQGEHLDVGFLEHCQGAEAVGHVPGDAGEGVDVEPVDGLALGCAAAAALAVVALGFGGADQGLVGVPLAGGATADALVDEPVLGWDVDAVLGGALGDDLALLLHGLVLARVTAAQVGGSDDHAGLPVE